MNQGNHIDDGHDQLGSRPIPKFMTGLEVGRKDYLSLPRTPDEFADPDMHRNFMALGEFLQRAEGAEGVNFSEQLLSFLSINGQLNILSKCCQGTHPEIAKDAILLGCRIMILGMREENLNCHPSLPDGPPSFSDALRFAQSRVMAEGIRPLEEIARRREEGLRPLTQEEEQLVLMHESQEAIRIIEGGGELPISLFESMPRMKFLDPTPAPILAPALRRSTRGRLVVALGLAALGTIGGIKAISSMSSSETQESVDVSEDTLTIIDDSKVNVGGILDFKSFEEAVKQGYLVVKDGQMVPKDGYDWAHPEDQKSFSVKRVK